MKKILLSAALTFGVVAGAAAATDIGVSIGINQPGVYGRIDIGNAPQPVVVYPQPVVIAPPPRPIPRQPIYLYVPPAHQQHWAQYCGRYSACGQPVYFVQESWVRDRYERAHPGYRHDNRRDWNDDRRGPPGHNKHDRNDRYDRNDNHRDRDRDDHRR